MSHEEYSQMDVVQVVEAFNGCINLHDLEGTLALLSEDTVFENTYPAPAGTRYEGKDAVLAFWQDFFQSSPTARFETEEMIVAGDRCVVRWRYIWDEQAGYDGFVRGVDLFRIRDGKIAEKLSYVKG